MTKDRIINELMYNIRILNKYLEKANEEAMTVVITQLNNYSSPVKRITQPLIIYIVKE